MINLLKTALNAGRKFIESVQGLATESEALPARRSND
jgi:hypothetical protein